MQHHPSQLVALILCCSSLWGSTTGKGLWPCLRHLVEDNPSAQYCLLNSGRILGIEGFSHVLTWASPLQSSRALHLLPSLKNRSVFQTSAVCCTLLSWLLMEYPESLSSFLEDHGLSIISGTWSVLFSPSFPCRSQEAPLRTDLKLDLVVVVILEALSWYPGAPSHVP